MASTDDVDEMGVLMPRIRATLETNVDRANLKQYMSSQLPSIQRSNLHRVVHKDAQGFDDIDEFWVDDEEEKSVFDEKEENEVEDSSRVSDHSLSSINTSVLSTQSETRGVRLSGLSDDESFVEGDKSEPMELSSQNEVVTKPLSSPTRPITTTASTVEVQKNDDDDDDDNNDYDMPFGDYDHASIDEEPKTPAHSRRNREKHDNHSFLSSTSPFSVHETAITPLSNASDKHLGSIRPFKDELEHHKSPSTPDLRIRLFDKKTKTLDDSMIKKRPRTKMIKKQKENTPPNKKKTKKTRKDIEYLDPQLDSDGSLIDAATDGDESFALSTPGRHRREDSDEDSDTLEHHMDISHTKIERDRRLSHAADILRDTQNDWENDGGPRRSTRRRFKPLAWYKGEHLVYERRLSGVGLVIPTVAGVERAGVITPQKRAKKITTTTTKKSIRALSKNELPKGIKYEDGEWADLYDVAVGSENKMNVICRANEIDHHELPQGSEDDKYVTSRGYAGQSFNLRSVTPYSRWISGRVGLPSQASKDAESVGDAVQVFLVMNCQPKSLEVALGNANDGCFDLSTATRFLLSPGDEFYVPSRNAYYLKNHSKETTAELHFMILKASSTFVASPSSSTKSELSRKQTGRV